MFEPRITHRLPASVVCTARLEGGEGGISIRLRDFSPVGAKVEFLNKGSICPESGNYIDLKVAGQTLPAEVVNVYQTSERCSLGIRFREQISDTSFRTFLEQFSPPGMHGISIIEFRASTDITHLSFFENLRQWIYLWMVVDASYQILAEVYSRKAAQNVILYPPRIRSVSTSSPFKASIEAIREVVDITKAIDEMVRHRSESKQLKELEVTKEQEKAKQEVARTGAVETETFIRQQTQHIDIMRSAAELTRVPLELQREEIALLREKLSLITECLSSASDLFGEGSEELALLRNKALPSMVALLQGGPLGGQLFYSDKSAATGA